VSTAPKLGIAGLLALLVALFAPSVSVAADNTALTPVELVRRAVQNEVGSNQGSAGRHFMFKDMKKTPQSSETKLLVETQDATAGLLVMQDGRPLTQQERQAEEARLQNYVQNSQELRKKRKQEKEDAEHTERILRALPDAFLYEHDGTQQGREGLGAPGDELLQLNFRPNPDYNPPSHVEQVLTGMHGHVLIDIKQERIAEIDGTLQKEVGFGWGILGHLDPGGRFFVQQADVGDHQWELTHVELSFTGKVLFVKKLSIHSSDTFSDFQPVPDNLTFAQGVELLKKEAAQNHSNAPGEQQDGNQTAQNRTRSGAKEQADKTLCCDRY
jgi:Skp family chaperone for outer membrane proteins